METSDWAGPAKKPMFGGLGYVLHGNMYVGIWRDQLIGRVGSAAEALTRKESIGEMDITGGRMRGWIKASPEGWRVAATRRAILNAALAVVRSLPKKPS